MDEVNERRSLLFGCGEHLFRCSVTSLLAYVWLVLPQMQPGEQFYQFQLCHQSANFCFVWCCTFTVDHTTMVTTTTTAAAAAAMEAMTDDNDVVDFVGRYRILFLFRGQCLKVNGL